MKKLLLVLGLGALVFSQACGDGTGFAAKVNGTVIKQSALDDELKAINNNDQYKQLIEQGGQGLAVEGKGKGTFNSAFVARVLTQEMVFAVIHNEVRARKLVVTQEEKDATRADITSGGNGEAVFGKFPKSYQQTLIDRLTETTVLEADLAGVKIDDAAIQDFYSKNQSQFADTCVRHILVDTKEQADAARARVVGGEDFAKVAAAVSKDTGSAQQGGDVGCDISGFVQEFKDAASTLPVNEISQPVQTQFGFHIIQVTKRSPKNLDAALRAQIRNNLIQPGIEKAQDLIYTKLSQAKVTVNPRIGKFDKGDSASGQPPQVVPNEAPAPSTTLPGPGTGADNGSGVDNGTGTAPGAGAGAGAPGSGAAPSTGAGAAPANP